ncbi:hypothetical protein CK203_064773 [Vitis vinifera]|uniref:Uncharacterized protein n=1 Tax=Vitis vinifera TaxID=29760 RepID=A0A438FPY8_VITVI|nr:hypothetical protein CK203_064773 [Vitis vinifera]
MKDGESSSKAAKGRKTKETEHPISRCQIFAHLISRCENFAHLNTKVRNPWPKEAIFAHPNFKVRNQFQGAKSVFKVQKLNSLPARNLKNLWNPERSSTSISAMAKTRGGLSGSPSSPTPRPHRAAMGAAPSPPVQAPAIPPSEGEAPSQRRYPTRRPPTDPVPPADRAQRPAPRPPAKRTKFSGPGESSHAPQAEPPTEEPRIPVEITPRPLSGVP